ncbi:hypothetical protein SEA_ANNADREAMY_257 [Streptomyces phage Annadreamy]|uniref:Uncharacterized protein n=2 Tax=Annadreamyvirus annadreamy TaxID=2846392 RepID=A0A345GTR4_9CAUD|nr:hypothetical protein HWB75_gp022 [Streptomyces phage Annadreamy]AXG66336.1 hypothetical protein SEA_ANNADREAMY_257 [Streptomyces phage Annadreamy]QGH79564.1 hypothetical protein SEA_LIMPID_263 [Streptomyces phage Limpid]
MHRTKLEILAERIEKARKELAILEGMATGLENIPLNVKCTGCGELLATEKDFAGHFLVPDEQLLNTGYCPNNRRNI